MLAALLVLLPACDRGGDGPKDRTAGTALEKAAVGVGLIGDPDNVTPTGVFAADGDRVCVLPADRDYRIGASVDYGEGQRCIARGTARGRGTLRVDFGGGCGFDAQVDADRLSFPAILPPACDRLCDGRASLAALRADRLSYSPSEGARSRGADGALLCVD